MQENIKFDYYYGTEAEQFTFYRLPKMLFTEEKFKGLSSDAKILYGIMLDRMSLSIKNQWIDKENRVYIIFTLENVMEVFSCSERKASYLMKELDSKAGIGLIEKKRQGLGKPNLIYLKNFIFSNSTQDGAKEEKENEVDNCETSKKGQVKSGQDVQLQSGNSVPIKSSMELQGINTDSNNTEYSDTIYPSNQEMKSKKMDVMDGIEAYRTIIQKNIEYDLLKEKLDISESDYLEEIVELMVEIVGIPCDTVRIESKDIPYQLVKAKLLKLNSMHIEYVIRCLQNTTNKIRNIKGYLTTMLYNAPTTISSYYRAEVNYDMNQDYID